MNYQRVTEKFPTAPARLMTDDDPEPRVLEWAAIIAAVLVASAADLTSRTCRPIIASRAWGAIKVGVSLLIAGAVLQYALPYIMAP